MARHFRMTNEQVNKCMARELKEENQITVAYQKPATGGATISTMQQQLNNAKKNLAPGADVNLEVTGSDLNITEGSCCYTKKQLMEAKRKSLAKNTKTVCTKKQIQEQITRKKKK